jgi:hypothetical protein
VGRGGGRANRGRDRVFAEKNAGARGSGKQAEADRQDDAGAGAAPLARAGESRPALIHFSGIAR